MPNPSIMRSERGYGAVRHDPQDHVHAFGQQRNEVPERVMRRRVLRIAAIRLHFHGVYEVGKLDCVLDEEDGDVVADEIEVSFIGIKLHGKTAHVPRHVAGPGAAGHR